MFRAAWLIAVSLALAPAVARADISPPDRNKITLRLSVAGVDSVSHLSFFVSNCKKPDDSRLVAGEPIVCTPEVGAPVRVYGFRERDLIEMLDMIRRGSSTQESQTFLSEKAKYCGEVRDQDVKFLASSGIRFVDAKYTLEPFKKTVCKLTRGSATTEKKIPASLSVSETTPAPSASAAAAAPAPSATGTAAPHSSCGCESVGSARGFPWLLAALGLVLTSLRTWNRRSRTSWASCPRARARVRGRPLR